MERLYTSGTHTDSALKYYPDSPFCNKKTLYKIKGYVSRKVGTSFYFQDQASYSAEYLKSHDPYGLYVFTYAETPIRVGDYIEVIGAISSYGGCYQMQGVSFHTLDPDPNRDTTIISRGYISREKENAEKLRKLENLVIPEGFDFEKVSGLTIECRQKFKRYIPRTIGQASRISGVSPSDISVLLVYFGR